MAEYYGPSSLESGEEKILYLTNLISISDFPEPCPRKPLVCGSLDNRLVFSSFQTEIDAVYMNTCRSLYSFVAYTAQHLSLSKTASTLLMKRSLPSDRGCLLLFALFQFVRSILLTMGRTRVAPAGHRRADMTTVNDDAQSRRMENVKLYV
jgi:hypothetical protein